MRTRTAPTRQERREDRRASAAARRTAAGTPPRDPLTQQIDSRIDERFDGETTRSSVAILLSGFAVLMAAVAAITILLVAGDDQSTESLRVVSAAPVAGETAVPPGHDQGTAAASGKVAFEPYRRPDPTLPATPAGEVKTFRVDVFEHVTKVSAELPPTRVWSFGVNGQLYRGTGVSAPIVVTQGDKVKIELVNGGSQKMGVKMPHSIDFHSAEVAPNEAFATIPPGGTHTFSFVAE
ncbi:MAG TPA: hypothetical protein VFS26_10125, partial [Solirubrobacterales bacterium]|nr:hypothetical protein [Solirubrobacterales bacterium]